MPPLNARLRICGARKRTIQHVDADAAHAFGNPFRQHRDALHHAAAPHSAIISMPMDAISIEMK